jgi:hypothetical protein
MGLFLAMSGIIECAEDPVMHALRSYAEENDGGLDPAAICTDDEGCLIVSESAGGVTVLYPSDFFDWDDASSELSRRLHKPVFSLHIHDGNLWMYVLYENGEIVDQFNPVPDYWQELDEAERLSWRGNASEIVRRVPHLKPEQIANYLVQWGDEVFESDERKKAYPTDEHYYGDDWQLTDFMKQLKLDYPIDDRGEPHGTTYRFKCEPTGSN